METMWNYEEVFTKRYKSLCFYAYSIVKDQEDAESIVKDAFTKLWFVRDKIPLEGPVAQFLYFTVKNASLNLIRHQKVAKRHLEAVIYEAREITEDPLNPITRQELSWQVREIMETMPSRMLDALYLRYYFDMAIYEVAQAMGVSKYTVKEHLKRGKNWIKKRLVIGPGDRDALR